MPACKDMWNKRFNRLVVVEFSHTQYSPKSSRRMYRCICDCGKEVICAGINLRSGNTGSCGCLDNESRIKRSTTHGKSKTFEYKVWKSMRDRCLNPGCTIYNHYGQRGITICEQWSKFETFISDMGLAPDRKHSIERVDANGNYEPSNCKWIHKTMQQRNCRKSIRITFNGETRVLVEWSEHLNIPYTTLMNRYKRGWTVEDMLTKKRKNYALHRT